MFSVMSINHVPMIHLCGTGTIVIWLCHLVYSCSFAPERQNSTRSPVGNNPNRGEGDSSDLKAGKLSLPRKPGDQYIDERLEELRKVYVPGNATQNIEGYSSEEEGTRNADMQSSGKKSQEQSWDKLPNKKTIFPKKPGSYTVCSKKHFTK